MDNSVDRKKLNMIESGKRSGSPASETWDWQVYDILNRFASSMTRESILVDFPEVSNDDYRCTYVCSRLRGEGKGYSSMKLIFDQNVSSKLVETTLGEF